MQNSIYREEILEHYKDPQNFGKLKIFDSSSKHLSPFCGDEIEIFVKFSESQGRDSSLPPRMTAIEAVSFEGKGCAVSIAAASILTEYAKGKPIYKLTKFSEEDMLDLLDIEVSEIRKKCALLPLYTLKDCLS